MIDYPPQLPQTEIRQLIAAAQSGDIKAKNKIVMHNMRLICKLAAKWKIKEYTTVKTDKGYVINLEGVFSGVIGYPAKTREGRKIIYYNISTNGTTNTTPDGDYIIKEPMIDLGFGFTSMVTL
jgi:hypothetical protein